MGVFCPYLKRSLSNPTYFTTYFTKQIGKFVEHRYSILAVCGTRIKLREEMLTPKQTPIHSAHLNLKMLNFPNYNFPGHMSPYSQISNRGWHFKRSLGEIVLHRTFFLLLSIKVVWQILFTTLQNLQIGKIPWGFFHRCWRSVVHVQNWGRDANPQTDPRTDPRTDPNTLCSPQHQNVKLPEL